MTKLLFSDIDGTLLRKDGTISHSCPEAPGNGTGRAWHDPVLRPPSRRHPLVQSYLESLSIHFPYSYVIANNGALVYDCNERKQFWRTDCL